MGHHTFEIELSGEKFECRTTFDAICLFEDRAGVSIAEAWQDLAEGRMKFKHIATAVWAAINGERKVEGMKPLIYETIGQKVHEHGFMQCAMYASTFFANSLPSSDKGKESESDQKKSSE